MSLLSLALSGERKGEEVPAVVSSPADSSSSYDAKNLTPASDTNNNSLSTSSGEAEGKNVPNYTLVLKNLPFHLKNDKLLEILNKYEIKPQSVKLHYEGGVFKGMAFAKYKTVEEATNIFGVINGVEINGRKLRVEYKRKTPKEIDLGDDEAKKIMEKLAAFKDDDSQFEYTFSSFTPHQKKIIHQLSEKLGLTHFGGKSENKENKVIIVRKKDEQKKKTKGQKISSSPSVKNPTPSPSPLQSSSIPFTSSVSISSNENKGKKGKNDNSQAIHSSSVPISIVNNNGGQNGNSVGSKPQSIPSRVSQQSITSPPASLSTSPSSSVFSSSPSSWKSSMLSGRLTLTGIQPTRQPTGPDNTNTKGFSEAYRNSRKLKQ